MSNSWSPHPLGIQHRSIQHPIPHRLSDVPFLNLSRLLQVGNRPGDPQNPVLGAPREAEPIRRHAEQAPSRRIGDGMSLEEQESHLRIRMDHGVLGEAFPLEPASGNDARADRRGAFGVPVAGKGIDRDAGHLDVHVDSVEQGTADAAAVVADRRWGALAGAARIAEEATRPSLRCHFVISSSERRNPLI